MSKFLILLLASKTFAIGPGSSPTGLSLGAAVSCADGSSSNVDSGTLYLDCTNNRVGAGTTGPQTPLDVAGASQFGSGATKSTFTATGALNLASGAALTATGAAGNIISGSSITTSGGVFGVGGALTGTTSMSVPTGLLVTGPLASAILPSTVPFTSSANTFTATQALTGGSSFLTTQSSVNISGMVTASQLGVGTANPGTKLHMSSGTLTVDGTSPNIIVRGNGNTYVDVSQPTANTNSAGVRFYSGSTLRWNISTNQAAGDEGLDFFDNTAGAYVGRMWNGNLGLGALKPASRLHLSSGTLTVDGNTQLVANFGGTVRAWSRTKAQIDTLSAGAVGEIVFCSNCNTGGEICVSTGTAASQWHQIGRTSTIGCGSNE